MPNGQGKIKLKMVKCGDKIYYQSDTIEFKNDDLPRTYKNYDLVTPTAHYHVTVT